ncbi:MAG: L,D-transpeptidase family protein [Nitratireductor sp.]|nr:L,D-transpeptidase family protein [Nitratireductor sp.]
MRFPGLVSGLAAIAVSGAVTIVASTPAAADDDTAPLQIVVSINQQSLQVFRGTEVVAQSNVSSGKPGHSTPTGIFSILHKKKFHRSNIYSNAPMPWMQRLTWTGIALHESGSVPPYPASHGCVRLPAAFARELFGMTDVGGHVMITGDPVTPRPVNHSALPQPSAMMVEVNYDPLIDQWQLLYHGLAERGEEITTNPVPMVSTAKLLEPVRPDVITTHAVPEGKLPVRILVTRRTRAENAADVQRMLNRLGHDAGIVDGAIGSDSQAAIRRFQAANGLPETGMMTKELVSALYKAAGKDEPMNGKIEVRRDFQPVMQFAINIDDPELPLGTHLVTAVADGEDRLSWNAYTLENSLGRNARALYGIDENASDSVDVIAALDRIHMAPDVRKSLSAMVGEGASLAITDTGTERYTGWNTDFAIATQVSTSAPAAVAGNRKKRTNVAGTTRRNVERASTRRSDPNLPGVRRIQSVPGLWLAR